MNVRFYYHMTLSYFKIAFLHENALILPYIHARDVIMAVLHNITKICKPPVVYPF